MIAPASTLFHSENPHRPRITCWMCRVILRLIEAVSTPGRLLKRCSIMSQKPNFFGMLVIIIAAAVLVSLFGGMHIHWIPVILAVLVLGWLAQAIDRRSNS